MQMSTEISQAIVERLRTVLPYDIIITDNKGIIISATDEDRVGDYHQGAIRCMRVNAPLYVQPEQSGALRGTKPGITMPIEVRGAMIGAVGITGDPQIISQSAEIIRVAVISLAEQAYITRQSFYKDKQREDFARELFMGETVDAAYLDGVAANQGIDLNVPCSIVVLAVKPDKKKGSVRSLYTSIAGFVPVNFYAYMSQGRFVLAVSVKGAGGMADVLPKIGQIEGFLAKSRLSFRLSYGSPRSGVEGYRISYTEARQGLEIGEKLSPQQSRIGYQEFFLQRLLINLPDGSREWIAKRLFDKAPLDETLFKTLRVYYENNQNISDTCDILHIHRNTLAYRLNQVMDLYGLDPRSLLDSIELMAAIICIEIT